MARFALGVDFGGAKIAAAVVDGAGAVRGRQIAMTSAMVGAEAVQRAGLDLSRRMLDRAEAAGLDITAAGVSSAGEVPR